MNTSSEYVEARRVLFDALDTLSSQRDGLVLVGAQAVYLRVGDTDLDVALHTLDADLGVQPSRLDPGLELATCMTDGGFEHASDSSVGIWVVERRIDGRNARLQVDLLVPEAVCGRTGRNRRSARLPPHHKRAMRVTRGLEGALFDADPMTIDALDSADERRYTIDVAGPAALIVSKCHKIQERLVQPKRAHTVAKDALDVARLLRGTSETDLAQRWGMLLEGAESGDTVRQATAVVSREALEFFRRAFGRPAGRGCELAVQAAIGAAEPELLRDGVVELSRRVLSALDA